MRSLGKKPHFWPPQRLKKVLLTTQGCARLRTGPINNANPSGLSEKNVYCVERRDMCESLGKKPHFWPLPEAKKGVVNYAKLRKAAHWPNNNGNGAIRKNPSARYVQSLGKKKG